MPTTHVSDVTQDKCILLYCIPTRKLVAHQMVHGSHMKGTNSLYFPTIITLLCALASVKWDDKVGEVPTAKIFNKKTFKSYKLDTDRGSSSSTTTLTRLSSALMWGGGTFAFVSVMVLFCVLFCF